MGAREFGRELEAHEPAADNCFCLHGFKIAARRPTDKRSPKTLLSPTTVSIFSFHSEIVLPDFVPRSDFNLSALMAA